MKSHFCVTTLFALAAAQKVTVPADLAQSFSSSGTEGLQVSFGSDASEGITNGQTISLNGQTIRFSHSPSLYIMS